MAMSDLISILLTLFTGQVPAKAQEELLLTEREDGTTQEGKGPKKVEPV